MFFVVFLFLTVTNRMKVEENRLDDKAIMIVLMID